MFAVFYSRFISGLRPVALICCLPLLGHAGSCSLATARGSKVGGNCFRLYINNTMPAYN